MVDYDDTSIMISEREYYYTDDDSFSASMDFRIAFGLTKYDGDPNSIEDPDYGTTKVYYRAWGFDGVHATGV